MLVGGGGCGAYWKAPLRAIGAIGERHAAIAALLAVPGLRGELQDRLREGRGIVRLAAPFAPFNKDLGEFGRLEIIRTWRFERGGRLSSR